MNKKAKISKVEAFALPATLVDCTVGTFKKIGLTGTMSNADDARLKLAKDGVTLNLDDNTTILVKSVTDSVNSADKYKANAALGLGIIAHYKVWESTLDPNGKPYGEKGMGRFIKDAFPGFSPKTMISYMTAGKNIYLPVERDDADYEGLSALANLPVSVTKEVASIISDTTNKTADGETYADATKRLVRKALADKGLEPLTSRDLAAIRRTVKGDSAKDKDNSAAVKPATAETASGLEGGATQRIINRIFTPSVTDGELSLTIMAVPGNDRDTVTGLFKAASTDSTKAKLLALAMYNLLIKNMPAKEAQD